VISKFKYKAHVSAICLTCLAVPALAQEPVQTGGWQDKIKTDIRVTLQYITEENKDLGTANDEMADSFSQQIQLMTGVDFNEDLFGFFHGRALNIDGETGFEDETGQSVGADQSFFELRELYLQKKNLAGIVPLSLQVGRQRVREPRALWWNSDNDLVRLNYNSTLLNNFIAVGENLSSYRSNTDSDFREDDENRFRVLGESSWQYKYNHFLEGRFLYEDDHSGLEDTGSIVPANNRDNEDQNLFWAGVRAAGEFREPLPAAAKIKYRADIIGVAGEEDILNTASAGTDARLVTGSTNRDVLGWGLDAAATVDPFQEGGFVFSLGYAFGSGDDGSSGTDNAFRQTDMQGNSSRVGLERQQQKNYGEVLRPELSNIHVLSAGAGYPISEATDVSLTYFYYRLDEEETSLRSSGISAPLNGNDKSLGQGLDFALNMNVGEEFGINAPYADRTDFRFVAGTFFPGDAYDPSNDNAALRLFTELRFKF
jgi:alginate production protein